MSCSYTHACSDVVLPAKPYTDMCQVYHTEEGTRHKFFRVYPYIKQLRRWIKNKRREQLTGKNTGPAAARADLGSDSAPNQHQNLRQQQQSLPKSIQHQQANLDDSAAYNTQSQMDDNEAKLVAMPAPVTHCSVPEQPGQAWLQFTLDRERVLQHLAFPALPPTAF